MTDKLAQIGRHAPLLAVSEWVQGGPVNFDQLLGRVVLVEVFQVNCPGCFLHALPKAVELHRKYADAGLAVLGVATAFENFDKNTLENLRRLVERREVIGETFKVLSQHGQLDQGLLPYRIPFPLAMDQLTQRLGGVFEADILGFIHGRLLNFDSQPDAYRQQVIEQVRGYLESLHYRAETFERFQLKGTPSQVLVDRQGVLRASEFGAFPDLESCLIKLLQEG
ncbi:TlpA family protein disulfide reductase [Methylomicrobium sp. Wu6]|uniref:TlpA family protein disulfide reductase n=1 Tax=Methylomicrobium sp. Wu6 TaxID=3107928 RepID=UPI002DD67FA3|nr:TlpA family protein disulfide reductase [Methylomicrobium sp. Wu6]MEC4748275.1 TlpA family protein disulfide reductase [Methylomicrobium sp. Wu6]